MNKFSFLVWMEGEGNVKVVIVGENNKGLLAEAFSFLLWYPGRQIL
ncbi:hypothetical protein [Chitinophaga caseinilytica]